MNIKDLISGIEDTIMPLETPVKILINGVRYYIHRVSSEEYADGTMEVLLEAKKIK